VTIESIKSATADDEAAVIGVFTLAFSTDPVARWLYPNPREYLAHFPRLALAIGGKAFANSSAHYADGFAGATLWLAAPLTAPAIRALDPSPRHWRPQ
jgi:hypothetical protein